MRHTGTQTIATERLTLRRFTIEDAENMYTTGRATGSDQIPDLAAAQSVEETAEILQQWKQVTAKMSFISGPSS